MVYACGFVRRNYTQTVAVHSRTSTLFDARWAAMAAATVALSVLAGAFAAESGEAPSLPVIALLALAGGVVLFSVPPHVLFLAWFLIAPFVQESASYTEVGRPLGFALYLAPPLVFAIWTLTRASESIRPRFLDVFPLAYLLYVVVSLLVTGDPSSTLLKGVYTSIGIGIVLYYFFAIGPIGSLTRENIAAVLLLITVAEGVMSIVDVLIGWNLWHDTGWQLAQSRAVATLANPAVLGSLLGMGIVLGVAILVWNGPARLRILAIVAIGVGLPGLFFTLTRAPILATLAVVILILMSRAKTQLVAIAALAVAVVAVTASWSTISASTVYRERVTNSGNVEARVLIQDWSLKLAAERPLFGWGYDSFDRAKNAARLSSGELPASVGIANTSHNSYLTILVEYGAVGLALLAIPWLLIPWRALRTAVREPPGMREPQSRWFVVGAVAALIIFVLSANTIDVKYFSFVPAVPWLLLGILRRPQLARR
jgi:O-antigen ligase